MPEADDYMFGTAWSNWSWWKPDGTGTRPNRCEENHYYLTGSKWVPNGGPNAGVSSDSNCKGCSNTYSIEDVWDTLSGGGGTGGGGSDCPDGKFCCDDGCEIPATYEDDYYCDCAECEDEPSFTCESCRNVPEDCDYLKSCGSWRSCTSSGSRAGDTDDTRGDGASSSSGGSGNNGGLNGLEIALIVIGCIGALIIVAIGICFACKKYKNETPKDSEELLGAEYEAPKVAMTETVGQEEDETTTRVY